MSLKPPPHAYIAHQLGLGTTLELLCAQTLNQVFHTFLHNHILYV